MKRLFTLLIVCLLLFFMSSCNDYYKSANDYYSLGKFGLAKQELAKIKESDSDYEKKILLLKQISLRIDSSKFKQAQEEYVNNNFYKSVELLMDIKDNSPLYKKKIMLLKQIPMKIDSSRYYQALKYYSDNYLDKSEELLEKIKTNSGFNKKRNNLLMQISIKRKGNLIKEKLISKAVISSIFGQSPLIMKVKNDKTGLYIVTYYNIEASKNYSYKVKFEGKKVIWGADDGRWRYDNIYYSETKDAYYITEEFGDGSNRKDKFYKKNLK